MIRAFTVAALLAPLCCLAADKLVVAVLYFDNNTPHREYDVLQKGLADMLVTDLSAVESLQVVEREKLQALVDELKLQKSRYFDPATAQTLGRGIGARYAVTGSMQAFDPELRIDLRLIEVASGKVVMADKVVGAKDRFFELEQKLVEKFVGGLNVRLALASGSGVKDVATLLDYSRGVDQADQGDLQGASKKLAELVKAAPGFKLARSRYLEVLKRLRTAGERRQEVLSAAEQALLEKIDRELTAPPGLLRFGRQLGYRQAKGHFLLARLRKLIGPPNLPVMSPRLTLIRAGDRPAALALMRAYVDNGLTYLTEAEGIAKPKAGGAGQSLAIDPEDAQRLVELGLDHPPELGNPTRARRALAEFAVYGTGNLGWNQERTRPALAESDATYAARALSLYAEAAQQARAHPDAQTAERETVAILEDQAEALVYLKRKEEALVRWQEILDRYPKTPRYREIENKIEQVLGLSKEFKELEAATALCDTVTNARWMVLLPRLIRLEPEGLFARAEGLVRACPGKPHASWMPRAVFQTVATAALEDGECELFKAARRRVEAISADGKGYLDLVGAPCGR